MYVDNENIYKKRKILNNAGVLIDHFALIESLTGLEYLVMLAKLNKKIKIEKINTYLKLFNLYEKRNTKISKYSQGMKQKIAIIQALMENPKYIILDILVRKFIFSFDKGDYFFKGTYVTSLIGIYNTFSILHNDYGVLYGLLIIQVVLTAILILIWRNKERLVLKEYE